MIFYFAGINAKYSHTALGIRTVAAYCRNHYRLEPLLGEFTINQPELEILEQLYSAQADAYFFSCYIWNIGHILRIAGQLAQILPHALIFLAGPEATYKAAALLREYSFIRGIILGEGEETTAQLLLTLQDHKAITMVGGLCLPEGKTPERPKINMDTMAFAYPDLNKLEGRILYYESMRGCPFSCSYCLSSVEQELQLRAPDLVKQDLAQFLQAQVRQVKFVDRTFNCNKRHAMEIWRYLIVNDNGTTNFHFEMAADLLDSDMLELLTTARPGLFQFEIGVQSTNLQTLAAIDRVTNLDKVKQTVLTLKQRENIHLHLDLIAGLPYEDLESFQQSFNWVYRLQPEQFQLGFLKVLGGSQMQRREQEYGLKYSSFAPFEVLETHWLTFPEILVLHGVEQMVETYYNSGRFHYSLAYLEPFFETPYQMYLLLSEHYAKTKGEGPLSKIGFYELLGSFANAQGVPCSATFRASCRLDLMLHEKPKKYPTWAQPEQSSTEQAWIWDFYHDPEKIALFLPNYQDILPKQLARMTHLECLPFHPESRNSKPTAVLVDYQQRDITGRAKPYYIPYTITPQPD